MFRDEFGTTPVTNYGQPIGLQLDLSKSLALGDELVVNGDFASSSNWVTSSWWTISGGVATMPTTSAFAALQQSILLVAGKIYKITFDVVSITGSVKVEFITNDNTSGSAVLTFDTNGSKVFYLTALIGASKISFARNPGSTTTCVIDNISVKEIPGNHRFSESAARPTLELSASGKPCLYYPGTGRYMQTNPFAWDSDEMSAITGVRKLAETGVIINFSPSIASNNGSFAIKNISGGYAAKSKGTVESESSVIGYGLPITSAIGVRSKISTDINELWVDGGLKNTATIDQGTGNFGTFGLYFGSNGTSEFSTMHEFSSCGFNRFLTDAQFAAMNRYINNKTGAY